MQTALPISDLRPAVIGNELLRSFSPEDRAALLPHLRRVRLSKAQVVYERGEAVDRVYFIESGLVSLVTVMATGHEVETTSRGRDGAIAHIEAVGSGVIDSRAVVQIPGEALCVPAAAFQALHQGSADVRRLMLRRAEYFLSEARQASACRALHPAYARLARTLLDCHRHTGLTRLSLTHAFLAGMVGVSRTTVTHAAGRLQDLALIRYARGVVLLTDLQGLQAHACECHEALQRSRRRMLGEPPDPRR